MKKILILTGSLASSSNRSLPFLQSCTSISFNGLRYARFATSVPENSSEEKADLHVTEIASIDRIKKKDSTERAVSKTLLLNATVDWSTKGDAPEEARTAPEFVKKREKRSISFKIGTKQLSAKYPAAVKLLPVVRSTGFDQQIFHEMIMANPEISTYTPKLVTSNLAQLMRLGFSAHNIKIIVRRYPHLLEYEGDDIFDTFEVWRKGGLFENFLINLFTRYPLLFSLPDDEVLARLKRIKYLMVNKINRVTAILERNASIMAGDWDRVEENFIYLYKTMRVTEKDISRSKAVSLPLSYISLRHTFLEKCGEYIRPKKKEELGFKDRKNPSLFKIIDTTDEVFSLNVAKVSLEEYLVFKKLMKYEDESDPVISSFDDDGK